MVSISSRTFVRRKLSLENLEIRQLLAGDADLLGAASGDVSTVDIAAAGDARERNDPAGDGGESAALTAFASQAELEDYLIDKAVGQWKHALGETLDYPPGGWWWGPWYRGGPFVDFGPELTPSAGGDGATPPDHSDTNVQVDGVDEADIVETDGDYLYMVQGDELIIFDSFPAEETNIVSRTKIEGSPIGMFLRGDRLTVVSNEWNYHGGPHPWEDGIATDALIAPPYWNGKSVTTVTVLDVSDRTDPTAIEQFEIDGSYVTSRSIDGEVQVITQNYLNFPVPAYKVIELPPEKGDDPDAEPNFDGDVLWWPPYGRYRYEVESEASYRERLKEHIVEWLPQIRDGLAEDPDASAQLISDPAKIFKPTSEDDYSLTSIVSIDTAAEEPALVGSTSIFDNYAGTVYVSRESIYTANGRWMQTGVDEEGGEIWGYRTEIKKFALTSDGPIPEAVGWVNGNLLNQFSMDEHDGKLRIGVTENGFWGRDRTSANHVIVLEEQGDELAVIGKIEDIAPGERIFSARFIGDRGFIVTFRQIDPLFTLDLSNPTDPQVVGELKLPGFSSYLQPLDENHILGIGRDADPETGRVEEVQMSIFDISDFSNPQVESQYSFDILDWGWSEAQHNHLAVGWYPEYDTLAVPFAGHSRQEMVDPDGDGRGWYRWKYESGLYVFDAGLDGDAEADEGISLRGVVEHDSTVRRSVRIEDHLYSISDESLLVVPILNPAEAVAEVFYNRDYVGIQNDPLGDADKVLVRAVADGAAAAGVGPAEDVGRRVPGRVQAADHPTAAPADLAIAVRRGGHRCPEHPGDTSPRRRRGRCQIGATWPGAISPLAWRSKSGSLPLAACSL